MGTSYCLAGRQRGDFGGRERIDPCSGTAAGLGAVAQLVRAADSIIRWSRVRAPARPTQKAQVDERFDCGPLGGAGLVSRVVTT